MTIKNLIAICIIAASTAIAWFALAGVLSIRSESSDSRLSPEITRNWGPELTQQAPAFFYEAAAGTGTRMDIAPESSDIHVKLVFDPKQKGLLWYRTYSVHYEAE